MSEKNNIIKSVKLDLGSKEDDLTMEQAQQLKDALDELFGAEIVKTEPQYVPMPYPQPYPVYPRPWYWEYPTVTWETGTAVVTNGPARFTTTSGATTQFAEGVLTLGVN